MDFFSQSFGFRSSSCAKEHYGNKETTSNKGIATSNKCIATSSKKLRLAIESLLFGTFMQVCVCLSISMMDGQSGLDHFLGRALCVACHIRSVVGS